MRIAVLALIAACGGAVAYPRATTGSIAGLARDHDSGDPLEQVIIKVASREVKTDASGGYRLLAVPPGTYRLEGTFAGQPITVEHVPVRVGNMTVVDLLFTLGRPAVFYDFAVLTAIDRYTPKHLDAGVALIEGTVNDAANHDRIAGAVVTAVGPGTGAYATASQVVSDDQGRYKFENAQPGVYVVSTYYSVGGHGQIEVRRSDIDAIGGQAVVVPLWIEAQR